MEPWSAGAGVVWMSLAMGVGAFLVSRVVHYWWRGTQIPKQHSEWVDELDHAVKDLHAAEIGRAVCYRRVADLIGQMPQDFDPVALGSMQMSNAMGRAILSKAEQLGLYPRGTFSELGVKPLELPEPEPARKPTNGGRVLPWIGDFVGGRLVPRASEPPPGPPN